MSEDLLFGKLEKGFLKNSRRGWPWVLSTLFFAFLSIGFGAAYFKISVNSNSYESGFETDLSTYYFLLPVLASLSFQLDVSVYLEVRKRLIP